MRRCSRAGGHSRTRRGEPCASRHIAVTRAVYRASCCLLALAVALFGLGYTSVFSQLAARTAQAADSETAVTGISLKVYPMAGDGDTTWVVPKNKKSTTTIATRGGQLRIAITVERVDQDISETDEESWAAMAGFELGFTYSVDDPSIVTVDSTGVITALSDGTTTITVTPNDEAYADFSASVDITACNQAEGMIVSSVDIVDEEGDAYGDQKLRVYDTSTTVKLYVRVTYVDTADSSITESYCNAPGADESEAVPDGAFDTLVWAVSDSNYASISSSDGVGSFKGLADSTIIITARITGGDASVDAGYGYGVVVGKLTAVVNTGTSVDGEMPADSLTIEVVYEEDPDTVIVTQTYSAEEFELLGAETISYTLTRSNGKYVTDTGYGVTFTTMLAAFDIAVSDISYFTLTANDGANPGKISAGWLLETTRYYLPNYDLGGSLQEKEKVVAMLALEDSWTENSVATGDMNSGTRFRLLFGSATTADNATDKSIKFINTFTIVLEGAAPSETDDEDAGDDGSGESGSGDGGSGDGAGAGSGAGDGDVAEGGQGDDVGIAQAGAAGGSSAEGAEPVELVVSGETAQTQEGVTVAQVSLEDAEEAADVAEPEQLSEDSEQSEQDDAEQEQSRWRIFQMMNNTDTELDVVFEENPLAPYVLPAALVLVLLAVLCRLALFVHDVGGRRRLQL